MIDVTCLINNVVVTNKIDKLTVTDASKYIGLKNVVAYDIRRRRNDGKYVVRISLVRRRLNTISIFKPCVGNSKAINYFFPKIYADGTWIIVVKTPCLNVVLSQLCISEQIHVAWNQFYIALVKLFHM